MTAPARTPPRSDAELAARIAAELQFEPATPAERARLAARVQQRIARTRALRLRWAPLAALAAAAAALAIALAPRSEPPRPRASELSPSAATLTDSWQEQLLYAPEWLESDTGFVDGEVLPDDYAVASALLEP